VEVKALRVDLEQREVRVGVDAADLGGDPVAVAELDEDLLGLLRLAAPVALATRADHVGVGEDLALVGDDEPRALARPAAQRVGAGAEDRDDRDHCRRGVLVDLGGVEVTVRGLHDDLLGRRGRGGS